MCEWAAQPHARVHRQQNTLLVSIQATSRQVAVVPAHVACALDLSRRPRVSRALAVAGRNSCYPHAPLCLAVVAHAKCPCSERF